MEGLTGELYPAIAQVKGAPGCDYRVTFEARARGEVTRVRLGLGVIDGRGWEKTLSGIAVEGIEQAEEWRKFEGVFNTLPDCPGVYVTWRLLSAGAKVSGIVEVRNLKVVALRKESFPAYPAITASASLSADGKKLFLIVFNKDHADDMDTRVRIDGFPARNARRWTVTGPSLESTNLNQELVGATESGLAMAAHGNGEYRHVFPARSMTAVEFVR
jgi:alpha-N-arabinofuranosidase